jgi:hypothetical protein
LTEFAILIAESLRDVEPLFTQSVEMPRDERLLIERWLGRVLSDDEIISVSVYRPHPGPAGPELAASGAKSWLALKRSAHALKVLPRTRWTR